MKTIPDAIQQQIAAYYITDPAYITNQNCHQFLDSSSILRIS